MRQSAAFFIVALAASANFALAAKPAMPVNTFTTRAGTSLLGDGVIAPSPVPASEATFTYDLDITGWVSNGDFTNPTNSSAVITLIPNAYITGVEWLNLSITATAPSWLSDFALSTNQSSNTGLGGTFWDHRPSTTGAAGTYTGSGAFGNPSNQYNSGPYQLLADGQMLVYVYEDFDDEFAPQTVVNSGTLRITYSDIAPPPPTPPTSTPAVAGGTITSTLTAGEIEWYSFTWAGGEIDLNTEGSLLLPDNDTEIGLYDALTGALIASDDDTGTGNLSQLTGTLAAGDYLLAVGAYNTTFAGAFGATSASANTGLIVINGISVPEPTSLAALGMVGLIGRRRR